MAAVASGCCLIHHIQQHILAMHRLLLCCLHNDKLAFSLSAHILNHFIHGSQVSGISALRHHSAAPEEAATAAGAVNELPSASPDALPAPPSLTVHTRLPLASTMPRDTWIVLALPPSSPAAGHDPDEGRSVPGLSCSGDSMLCKGTRILTRMTWI